MNKITEEIIDDILDNVINSPKKRMWKNGNIQFCCTIHGESNPSAGIKIDFNINGKEVPIFNCLSCGEKGSIPYLVYKSLPDQFKSVKQAHAFLKKMYGVDFGGSFSYDSERGIKRYEDVEEKKFVYKKLPRTFLAPYMSGKETYKYFFDRGFTKEDMKKYMIGRDVKNRTVTIPAFDEEENLVGLIGRYIDKKKKSRFLVYEFPKGSIIYPLDKVEVYENTLIGVESMLDCIFVRERLGYENCISILGDQMSEEQARYIKEKCETFICLFDNDRGGNIAIDRAKKMLKDITVLVPSYYPENGKDPLQWGEEETEKVINSAYKRKRVTRI